MNTVLAIIGAIIILIGLFHIAFLKVIENYYKEYTKEDVKKYSYTVAVGNALFGSALIFLVMVPQALCTTLLFVALMGIVIECMACFWLKHKMI